MAGRCRDPDGPGKSRSPYDTISNRRMAARSMPYPRPQSLSPDMTDRIGTDDPHPRVAEPRRRMLVGNHLVRGSLVLMFGAALSAVGGWLWWTLIARWSGASIVGEISALGAAAAVISLLAAQPVAANTLVNYQSLSPAARTAVLPVATRLVAVRALIVAVASTWLLRRAGVDRLEHPAIVTIYVLNAVAQAVGAFLDSFSLVHRASRFQAIRSAGVSLLRLALLGAAYAWTDVAGVPAIIGIWCVVAVLSVIAIYVPLRRLGGAGTTNPGDRRAAHAIVAKHVGAQTLIALGSHLPAQLLPALVVGLVGKFDGGLFAMAWLIGSVSLMLSTMTTSALLAEGSREQQQQSERIRHAAILSFSLVLPLVVAVFVFPEQTMSVFGADFAQASGVLRVLCLSAPVTVTLTLMLGVLRLRHALRAGASASVCSGIAAIAGTLMLTPHLGAVGAAWGWFAGQVLGLTMCLPALLETRPSIDSGRRDPH